MRIAIFTETFLPKWDGVANTVCHLLDHLALRGHASLMFAPRGAPSRYANTPIVGLVSFSLPLYPELRLVPPIIDVARELTAFHPDLVLLINPAVLGVAGLRHARTLDVPIVASYHTDIPGYTERYGLGLLRDPLWAYLRWLHNRADLNLCPSHYTQAELSAHGFKRVRVWSHGVDAERFHPRYRDSAWRRNLSGGNSEAPLLLYVGRLAAEKRVEWLHPVLDAVPEARLAIVGDGPVRAELEARFAGTPTVFAGYLSGDDLSHAYASADLFCFPSANETFGNVVLEAMASGLPVLAPRSGGPVDQVRDCENGLLTRPDDVEGFVAAARRLVSDRATMHRLGLGARAYAETQSWEATMDPLLSQLRSLVENHTPSHRRGRALITRPAKTWLGTITRSHHATTTHPGHE
jgi:glycosyltransferase involved in cell wall biosynthesis